MTKSLNKLYVYIFVCTVLHTQRLREEVVRLRTETQTRAKGGGQVDCIDLKIRQPLIWKSGAKPEVRTESKRTMRNPNEERTVTMGERFWGRYATFYYQTDKKIGTSKVELSELL